MNFEECRRDDSNLATDVFFFSISTAGIAAPVSEPAAKLLVPVFRAYASVHAHESEQTDHVLDESLQPILDHRNRATGEALAALLGMYVGTASGEDNSCELVHRGRSVMPFLTRFESDPATIAGVDTTDIVGSTEQYAEIERRITDHETCIREK